MQVPLPFARVAIRIGAAVEVSARDGGSLERLQAAMDANVVAATAMVGGAAGERVSSAPRTAPR
jgi:hypothetical protein